MKIPEEFTSSFGKASENFDFWMARTEAALEAEKELDVVNLEATLPEEGETDEATKKRTAVARAVINQGLGDYSLRLFLPIKASPSKVWRKLKHHYADSKKIAKIWLQTKFFRSVYRNESMQDYFGMSQEIFKQLESLASCLFEDFKVAIFLASFGDKQKSFYRAVIASLQTREEVLE